MLLRGDDIFESGFGTRLETFQFCDQFIDEGVKSPVLSLKNIVSINEYPNNIPHVTSGSTTLHLGRVFCPFPSVVMGILLLTALVASGFAYLSKRFKTSSAKSLRTVAVIVFGDLGRSPRICRQAQSLSAANLSESVALYGYQHSALPNYITDDEQVAVHAIPLPPLPSHKRGLFTALYRHTFAMTWVSWQLLLQHKLQLVLIQCPPVIPYMLLLRVACWLKRVNLVIDCHNYGYTLIALNKRLAWMAPVFEALEALCFRSADGVMSVTNTMKEDLFHRYAVPAVCVYDQPWVTSSNESSHNESIGAFSVLSQYLPATTVDTLRETSVPMLVTSTSYTADERIDLLLDALFSLSESWESDKPLAVLIITGKGPLQEETNRYIEELKGRGKHFDKNVIIHQVFTSAEDYSKLIACADLGISLHISSSGLDFPMKIVDYIGVGVPCISYDFPALSERMENASAMSFKDVDTLKLRLKEFLESFGQGESRWKGGASKTTSTWTEEWMKHAQPLFRNLLPLP